MAIRFTSYIQSYRPVLFDGFDGVMAVGAALQGIKSIPPITYGLPFGFHVDAAQNA